MILSHTWRDITRCGQEICIMTTELRCQDQIWACYLVMVVKKQGNQQKQGNQGKPPKCVGDVADECISVVLVAWQRVDDVVASVAAVAVVVHMDVVVVVFVVVIVAVAVIVVAVVVAVVVVVVLACDSRE